MNCVSRNRKAFARTLKQNKLSIRLQPSRIGLERMIKGRSKSQHSQLSPCLGPRLQGPGPAADRPLMSANRHLLYLTRPLLIRDDDHRLFGTMTVPYFKLRDDKKYIMITICLRDLLLNLGISLLKASGLGISPLKLLCVVPMQVNLHEQEQRQLHEKLQVCVGSGVLDLHSQTVVVTSWTIW